MKIKFLIRLLLLISVFSTKAQDRFVADFSLKTEPTENVNFNETNAGVFISKKIDTKNEISNTIKYTNLKIKYEAETYRNFENLNQFNQIQNKLAFSHQLTTATKLIIGVTPTFNFEQNLGISDLIFLGNFQFSYQLSSSTTAQIGFERSTVFGSPKFIPTVSFLKKITDKSSILIGFPDSKITYSNNERNQFSLTNSFNGNNYNLDKTLENEATKISTSQITTALEYERNMDKNWFVNFKAGYDFDKKYHLLDNNNHKQYDFNTGNGYIFSIGIKYKQ